MQVIERSMGNLCIETRQSEYRTIVLECEHALVNP
jgi:hypothetical protein